MPIALTESKYELLSHPYIHHSVHNSVTYGLEQMAERLAASPNLVAPMGNAFVTHLFPFYRRSGPALQVFDAPVLDIERFWHETSELTSYPLGELERYMLGREAEPACIFLQKVETALGRRGANLPIIDVVFPLREAIRKREFNYAAMDELTRALRPKL